MHPSFVRPFLKWPGGKYRVLDRIARKLPRGTRLLEPFAGSGAVFLNGDFEHYLVNDINPDLIDLYNVLKREGEDFIQHAKNYFIQDNNRKEVYYALRAQFNRGKDTVEKSALFLYLNRHGYNGLVRYNAGGAFNVPFGCYEKPYFPALEMRHFHRIAQNAEFLAKDFTEIMENVMPGDVIYADPPYFPLSPTASFSSYSQGGFGPADQCRLAKIARRAAEKGTPVLISNHDLPQTRALYRGARLESFPVRRSISCHADKRVSVPELLALFEGASVCADPPQGKHRS